MKSVTVATFKVSSYLPLDLTGHLNPSLVNVSMARLLKAHRTDGKKAEVKSIESGYGVTLFRLSAVERQLPNS